MRGGSGRNQGRPKYSRNKRTQAAIDKAAAGGEMPLDYMLRVMRDPKAKQSRRDHMAQAALPYLHARLAPAPGNDASKEKNRKLGKKEQQQAAATTAAAGTEWEGVVGAAKPN